MKFCHVGAHIFSTCAKAQYMAIIVDQYGHIDSTGYNGTPKGMMHCTDGGCPRFKNNVPPGTPYDHGEGFCLAAHAEQNCLMNSTNNYQGTMYVNGIPCIGCLKLIANSGLKRLCYMSENLERLNSESASLLLDQIKLTIIQIPVEKII